MKPAKRRSLWPFVALLLLLFGLSVAAPRLWLRQAGSDAVTVRVPPTLPPAPQSHDVCPNWMTRVEPASVPFEVTPEPKTTEQFTPGHTDIALRPSRPPEPAAPILNDPLPEPTPEPGLPPVLETPPAVVETPPATDPAPAVEEPAIPEIAWIELPAADLLAQRLPAALLEDLEVLAAKPEGSDWSRAVSQRLIGLSEKSLELTAETKGLLADLRQLAADAPQWSAHARTPEIALAFNRLGYALTRRLDLWERLYQGALPLSPSIAITDAKTDLSAPLAHLESGSLTADGKVLREWLLLEAVRQAAQRETSASSTPERRAIAQRVLHRMRQTRIAQGSRQQADRQALTLLETELRRWVDGPLTADQFLAQVERFEWTRSSEDARAVADLAQRLTVSRAPEQQELGKYLDTHYRNANLRLVANDKLLNRFLPEQQPVQASVSDYVAGVPVAGVSNTFTTLRVKMIPDNNCLKLRLEADGNICSQTSSTSGPATFYNNGDARYTASKVIKIVPSGIRVTHTEANANSDSTLRGLSTDYDGVPLIGGLVRNIARSQYDARSEDARWEVEGKISAQVKDRLDKELDARLAQAEQEFLTRVLKPLEKMELNPTCTSLQTTDQRAVVRLRLAADEQLAAFTPRPQAPGDSWASLQVHQSAINNTLNQLKLGGQTFTPAELQQHVRERTGIKGLLPEHGEPLDDVHITFAEQEPIRVDIRDGELIVSVSIAELATDKGKYKNFTGRAHYQPVLNGLQAGLQREGTLELIGEKLNTRSQVALRAVISKMFPKDRKLQIIPEKLQNDPRFQGLIVTQCALEDGWVGVAIAPDRNPPRTAAPSAHPPRR